MPIDLLVMTSDDFLPARMRHTALRAPLASSRDRCERAVDPRSSALGGLEGRPVVGTSRLRGRDVLLSPRLTEAG
jgi:hypothetical protein